VTHPGAKTGSQIAVGVAHRMPIDPDVTAYQPGGPAVEAGRLQAAIQCVNDTLKQLEAGDSSGIYAVQELMFADMIVPLMDDVAHHDSAVHAVQARFAAAAEQLESIDDPYLKARAEDQRGLSRMVLRALMGQPITPGLASGILIVDELDPLTASTIDPSRCQGVITIFGGATGHGAIVAQARGVALLTGRPEAAEIVDGTLVAFDPVDHRLLVNPSPEQLTELNRQQAERQEKEDRAAQMAFQPGVTKSGKRVLVEGNVSAVVDAFEADKVGAEGCGLVRTEILFSKWQHAPGAEEQAALYVQIGEALHGRMVTIRTWDPGGDKPLPFIPQEPEANPMLGQRGIRAMQLMPELFDEQLKAILLASRQVEVRVMFPMITQPFEMVWARARLAEVQAAVGGNIEAGMMVEVPSAALRASMFVSLADFISIGTNDLTQYTLAVDRGNPNVTAVAMGDDAAVYDLITMAATAFKGKPVAVCGDLASRVDEVPRLIAAGATELSVRPPLVGVIKQAVRESD